MGYVLQSGEIARKRVVYYYDNDDDDGAYVELTASGSEMYRSRLGPAVRRCWAGEEKDLGSNPLRISSLVNCCGLWALSL